jgi:hypothetical protein
MAVFLFARQADLYVSANPVLSTRRCFGDNWRFPANDGRSATRRFRTVGRVGNRLKDIRPRRLP